MPAIIVYVGEALTQYNHVSLLGFHAHTVFPETGLHAMKQAALALDFVRASIYCVSDVTVVTHSDALVCALCDAVHHKRLTPDQLKVIIVNADGTRDEHGVDDDGYLLPGWPFGYLTGYVPDHMWRKDDPS